VQVAYPGGEAMMWSLREPFAGAVSRGCVKRVSSKQGPMSIRLAVANGPRTRTPIDSRGERRRERDLALVPYVTYSGRRGDARGLCLVEEGD
jgi:hypothetical protein